MLILIFSEVEKVTNLWCGNIHRFYVTLSKTKKDSGEKLGSYKGTSIFLILGTWECLTSSPLDSVSSCEWCLHHIWTLFVAHDGFSIKPCWRYRVFFVCLFLINEQRSHCAISLVLVNKDFIKSEVTWKTPVCLGEESGD